MLLLGFSHFHNIHLCSLLALTNGLESLLQLKLDAVEATQGNDTFL